MLNPVPAGAFGLSNFAGGLATINERGGELVSLPRGATVVPHDLSRRMVDGAAGGMAITVNVQGANGDRQIEAMVMQGVSAGLAQYDRALPTRVQQIQGQPRRR